MEIFFATPTGARVGESIAQTINVILESLARACREFDSNKDTPRLVRSPSAGSADILSADFECVKLGSQEI